jgi:hypothetical protein
MPERDRSSDHEPITLRGSRNAILRSEDTGGDYGLSIGDYWRIEGITVAHASKGIVLDGSIGTVIDDVEVFDIGAVGVHFRACSSGAPQQLRPRHRYRQAELRRAGTAALGMVGDGDTSIGCTE